MLLNSFMKRKLNSLLTRVFLLAVTALWYFAAEAQSLADPSVATHLHCYTAQQDSLWRAEHPEMSDEIRSAELLLQNEWETSITRDTEYLISVVFHIVHNNGSENISVDQIEDAIRVMNEDFSATNSGAGNVNTAFAPLVADVQVGFALALRDPFGNCTNGIVRSQSITTLEGGENLKQVSPVWDRARYLNIWVCQDIASGAAGYTRYPSSVNGPGGAQIDGIVVRSDYVGAIGTSSVQRSHTLTHEVGHWINLPHLWGNSNNPGLASNCNIDDGVADTPNTKGWTTCSINGNSCGSLDNVENYMEYSFCSKMFTLGQAARMHTALNSNVSQRVNLWQPETLESTGVFLVPEVCSADFTADKRLICLGDSISFTDLSSSAATDRIWTFEAGSPPTSSSANPVVTYNTPGIYAVSVQVSDGQNTFSEAEINYIRVLDSANTGLPFYEGFEGMSDFNVNSSDQWFTSNQEGSIDWSITNEAAYSGNYSAFVRGYVNGSENVEQLLSQTFELNGITEDPVLTFRYACARRSQQSADRLRVYISKDCGESWSLRKVISGDALYTVPETFSQEFYPESTDDWDESVISSIVPIFHTSYFRVRFEFLSDAGNNFFLDDINLSDPTVLSATDNASLKGRITIYPNPANGSVNIDLATIQKGIVELQIFDLSGRLVHAEQWFQIQESGAREIDLSGLVNGLYVVQLYAEGQHYSDKIIVQR